MLGKNVAVIGAGSIGAGWGNGKATAITFARSGAKVLCVDRNEAAAFETVELIRKEGGVAEALPADVTNTDSGSGIITHMQQVFDGLDVIHYNVGNSSKGGACETSDADWDEVFDINLTGALRITRAALPIMREQKSGVFIFVSSLAATYSGPYSYVSYEASKAALCRFSKSVARENAKYGIRSNTILPGVIDTPHVSAFVDGETEIDELNAARAALVPMQRQGTAWDIANAARFLASDDAEYITGVDLRVDGGLGC